MKAEKYDLTLDTFKHIEIKVTFHSIEEMKKLREQLKDGGDSYALFDLVDDLIKEFK